MRNAISARPTSNHGYLIWSKGPGNHHERTKTICHIHWLSLWYWSIYWSIQFLWISMDQWISTVEPQPHEQIYRAQWYSWGHYQHGHRDCEGGIWWNACLCRWHCMWKRSCIPLLSAPTALRKSLFWPPATWRNQQGQLVSQLLGLVGNAYSMPTPEGNNYDQFGATVLNYQSFWGYMRSYMRTHEGNGMYSPVGWMTEGLEQSSIGDLSFCWPHQKTACSIYFMIFLYGWMVEPMHKWSRESDVAMLHQFPLTGWDSPAGACRDWRRARNKNWDKCLLRLD